MSQDALTKLAMELAAWPSDGREKVTPQGRVNEKMWLQRRAELINKPSWDDAPEWAEWLAQDEDGSWWFFNGRPKLAADFWYHGDHKEDPRFGKKALNGGLPAGHDWRQTLERRPTESKESGVMYAIHGRTKEHRPYRDAAFRPEGYEHVWEIVQADADGWIPWEGGECPLPSGQWVEVRYRIGACRKGFAGNWSPGWWSAPGDIAGPDDIIAYRPILDESSEPETPDDSCACGGRGMCPECLEPEAVEWDGEGLPPIGVPIESKHKGATPEWANPDFHETTIVAMGKQIAIFTHPGSDLETVGRIEDYDFRPIRSEEDRAVEAMLEELAPSMKTDGVQVVCRALYRAGYRKQEVE